MVRRATDVGVDEVEGMGGVARVAATGAVGRSVEEEGAAASTLEGTVKAAGGDVVADGSGAVVVVTAAGGAREPSQRSVGEARSRQGKGVFSGERRPHALQYIAGKSMGG